MLQRGILADLVRAGFKKLFSGHTKAEKEMAGYLKLFNGIQVVAHSEGTLILGGALNNLKDEGFTFEKQISIKWRAPVIMESTSVRLATIVGGKSDYDLNFADPIGVFTTPNLLKISIYGVLGIATLATYHSLNHYDE